MTTTSPSFSAGPRRSFTYAAKVRLSNAPANTRHAVVPSRRMEDSMVTVSSDHPAHGRSTPRPEAHDRTGASYSFLRRFRPETSDARTAFHPAPCATLYEPGQCLPVPPVHWPLTSCFQREPQSGQRIGHRGQRTVFAKMRPDCFKCHIGLFPHKFP